MSAYVVAQQEEWVEGYRRSLGAGAVRALRRGRPTIRASLDLHGLVVAEATRELRKFFQQQSRLGRGMVCVVHGKGLHSESGRGVLGKAVVEMLKREGETLHVAAFVTAPPHHGGTGALLVAIG